MERADDGALEETPHTLNAIGVHVADDPFLAGMADAFVSRVVVGNAHVGTQLVGVERFRLVFGDALHERVNRFLSHVRNTLKPNLAATLQRTSNPHAREAFG